MNQTVKIELFVKPETAAALSDVRKREAITHLVDGIVNPSEENDPLAELLDAMSRRAESAGLTEQDIDAELAIYNAERR